MCPVTQSCLTLCDAMDYASPGSSVHGIFQARVLEWVATSYSGGSSWPRDQTHISCISCTGRQILYHSCHLGSPSFPFIVVVQLCSHAWLCDLVDCNTPQASLSFMIFWSLCKLMSVESVMPSNHLILCHPLHLLPSVFPSIRVSLQYQLINEWLLCAGNQEDMIKMEDNPLPYYMLLT